RQDAGERGRRAVRSRDEQRYDRRGASDLNDIRGTSPPDTARPRIGVERQGKRRGRRQRLTAWRSNRLTALLCVAASALFAAPLGVHAQSYPSRPLTVVVPFPAGGPSYAGPRARAQ